MPDRPEKTFALEDGSNLPKQIGDYHIQDVLGEGGMGIVYLAEQTRPVSRKVALKLIKPGMDSRSIIARFESERQALALMDHPHIARVFDARTTIRDLPYFVMEFVDGAPLTEYCDVHRLSARQRVELFLHVCEGVQHAHQKGVAHRDLKPSNILVTEEEGEPVPKIIDFGLAKAMDFRLTEKTVYSGFGAFLGTPNYMSPEQAEASGRNVDTRTDIYSLGVILFELLTGRVPFEADGGSDAASLFEIRRRIQEDDPPRPSSKVNAIDRQEAKQIAVKRGSDRETLIRRLRNDLDWIVLKALEKDPNRRYPTAAQLRADLERHLQNRPVQAGPPSKRYKLKKFMQRHTGLLVAAAALLFVLIAGSVVSTILYFRAEDERRKAETARESADEARRVAESLLAVTQEEKRKAEQQRIRADQERERARESELAANEARAEAEAQRDEVLRLADVKRLRDYRQAAEDLWPAEPRTIGAMTRWIDRADQLLRRLPDHRASLTALREVASVSTGEDGKDSYSFGEDFETQWRHDTLAQLVRDLARFDDPEDGVVADVRKRLAFAQSVRQETIENHRAAWDEAIASIRNECPAYGSLEIRPQIGLIPLGRDPGSGLWEFGHLQTGQLAERDEESGRLTVTSETGLVLVLIPGGTFRMGGQGEDANLPNYDPLDQKDALPVHEVTLDPFFLSKYEMTQAQWQRFVGGNPSYYGPHNYDTRWQRARRRDILLHPVENMSWDTAHGTLTRLGLDLPTEAQWEYATRAGTTTTWWTGSEPSSLQGAANVADLFAKSHQGSPDWQFELSIDDGFTVHAPVGSFRANPFGLHDVHGNVFEWCRDRFGPYRMAVREGDGERQVAASRYHCLRGGAFDHFIRFQSSAARKGTIGPKGNVGVRPSRDLRD